jgi:hypothetical protein
MIVKIQAYKYNELHGVSKQRVDSHVYEAPFEYSSEGFHNGGVDDELDFEDWISWNNDTKAEYLDGLGFLFTVHGQEISDLILNKDK